ncbi:MAG TPA: membrane protein insertion efficiency factor YidD [Candidatus Acidoferrales bacterium]|nr:membrane protein insertion efficiency factor YidD [Candidatus Acidoferrales bacterium]
MLGAVRAYQVLLAPIFGGQCRFYPSCSHYTQEAIGRFGARRGGWLGLKRLLRCQPLSAGGYDPVPDNFSQRKNGTPEKRQEESRAEAAI